MRIRTPSSILGAILVAGVILGVAACNRDREAPPAPPPAAPPAAVTPADAAAPFAFESKTPFAEVSLELPHGLKSQPDLHARLYAAAVRDLRQFTEGAQSDLTEAGAESAVGAYQKTITFADAVETGKLFSLSRADYDFTGGAHGNTQYAGVLWDKALKRPIAAGDLFRKGVDLRALDAALCAAINAGKKSVDPQAQTVALGAAEGWGCPRAAETPFVLAPSTTPGKAGGLTFLIGPYVVGPYAEGSYEIDVPQAAFRALLAAAFVDEFAGEPAKRPDAQPL